MDWGQVERKYVEERIAILRHLERLFGASVIDEAALSKQRVIAERVRRDFAGRDPASMDDIFAFIFGEFEGAAEVCRYEVVRRSPVGLSVKVTHCHWANLYRELGAPDIGFKMVCAMDEAMARAINPDLRFTRSRTLMMGDECCDHTYALGSCPVGRDLGC